MKHQIMFSLICLSTLFLNNVFAAETCTGTSYGNDEYKVTNRFNWGYICSDEEIINKITLYKTPHSDSDASCTNPNLRKETLNVCFSVNCANYYNEEHPNGITGHGWFTAPNPYDNTEDDTDDICYTAYFYHDDMKDYPGLSNHPGYNYKKLGVGTLSKYDKTNYKYSGILSEAEIYNLTNSYDIETNIDEKFDLPHHNSNSKGTYNPVYKTKKIALIFSDFMTGPSTDSIKAQCKKDKDKCEMEICDFGNLADCVAPTIANVVGNQGTVEVNGVTYKTKGGKTYFATKFVTSPETEKNTGKRYEIIAGEPIPPETLKAIMDYIVNIYNQGDSSKQQLLQMYRLTDFTIEWHECPANHYCDENGQQQCPYGMKSEAGSDDITDCYIDEETKLCDSAGCFNLEEGTKAHYTTGKK